MIEADAQPSEPEALPDAPRCAGCGQDLLGSNFRIADGCPCNAPRGVNHGLVPKDVCTCPICDPDQTGGSRAGIQPIFRNP